MKPSLRTASLLIMAAGLFSPAAASAWDFSCSPRTSTTVEASPPPNIMLMLDRSGSMDGGDRDRSCRVCEEPDGSRYEVQSASECAPRGIPWQETRTASVAQNGSVSGFTHTLVFDALPTTTNDLTLELDIFGDSGGRCEWYEIEVDGVHFQDFNPRYGGQSCRDRDTTLTIPATFAADGEVTVTIAASPDNNDCNGDNAGCANSSNCDGVDASCGTNTATGVLTHAPRVYWGTQTWANPCGSEDKWDQAVRAIDLLTLEGESTNPEQAHFGFGYYHRDATSQILQDCRASNHTAIMSSLNPLSPDGGTPTALGIRTAATSACVADAGFDATSQTDTVAQNSANDGYDHTFTFAGISPGIAGANITVDFWGDFGASCEFAHVIVDGIIVGNVTGNRDCNGSAQPFRAMFDVPPAAIADGVIEVVLDTRGDNDTSIAPACSPSSPHVNAYCAENGATVTLRTPSNTAKGSATVLINDGAPTKSLDGREARHASVHEACEHRRVANVYVVGLGSGTDQDFNNILAVAGGTGTCTLGGAEVDPCTDPANWESLRGHCTGAFQADDGNAMLAALAAIRDEIACTYPVDFTSSNRDEVPADATNDYEYMWVEVLRSDTGTTQRVYHIDAASNPSPGLGWDFASARRRQIRLSPGYCNLVNSGNVRVVDTQLACLCNEVPGTTCSVPGADTLGVCPEGEWACAEGIDYCVPEVTCCEPDLECDTGRDGICAAGRTICDGNTERCVPLQGPDAEICDGIDNDCDGIIDELEGQPCTVPGQVGRCAAGLLSCADGEERCVQTRQPMPELCNGLDDDCDGDTDNITESWEKPDFEDYPYTPAVAPMACTLRNSCVCRRGTDDHAGQNYTEYIENWDPVCQCGAGLEWDDEQTTAPEGEAETAAGCATGSGNAAGWGLLALLFVVGRRRRRAGF